jgi:hypothetical protein
LVGYEQMAKRCVVSTEPPALSGTLQTKTDHGGEPTSSSAARRPNQTVSALAEIADALDKITVDELIANAAHQSRISELGSIGPSIPFVREVLSLRGRFGMS